MWGDDQWWLERYRSSAGFSARKQFPSFWITGVIGISGILVGDTKSWEVPLIKSEFRLNHHNLKCCLTRNNCGVLPWWLCCTIWIRPSPFVRDAPCRQHPEAFHIKSCGSLLAHQQSVGESWIYMQPTSYLLFTILDLAPGPLFFQMLCNCFFSLFLQCTFLVTEVFEHESAAWTSVVICCLEFFFGFEWILQPNASMSFFSHMVWKCHCFIKVLWDLFSCRFQSNDGTCFSMLERWFFGDHGTVKLFHFV